MKKFFLSILISILISEIVCEGADVAVGAKTSTTTITPGTDFVVFTRGSGSSAPVLRIAFSDLYQYFQQGNSVLSGIQTSVLDSLGTSNQVVISNGRGGVRSDAGLTWDPDAQTLDVQGLATMQVVQPWFLNPRIDSGSIGQSSKYWPAIYGTNVTAVSAFVRSLKMTGGQSPNSFLYLDASTNIAAGTFGSGLTFSGGTLSASGGGGGGTNGQVWLFDTSQFSTNSSGNAAIKSGANFTNIVVKGSLQSDSILVGKNIQYTSAITTSNVIDFDIPIQERTLTSDTTFTFANNAVGKGCQVWFFQDGTGSRNLTLPASTFFVNHSNQNGTIGLDPRPGKVTILTFKQSSTLTNCFVSGADSSNLVQLASSAGTNGQVLTWNGGLTWANAASGTAAAGSLAANSGQISTNGQLTIVDGVLTTNAFLRANNNTTNLLQKSSGGAYKNLAFIDNGNTLNLGETGIGSRVWGVSPASDNSFSLGNGGFRWLNSFVVTGNFNGLKFVGGQPTNSILFLDQGTNVNSLTIGSTLTNAGGTLNVNNLSISNSIYSTNRVWSGPNNEVVLNNDGPWWYFASANVTITNVNYAQASQFSAGGLRIINSSGGAISVSITANARARGLATTNSYSLPSGKEFFFMAEVIPGVVTNYWTDFQP